MTKHKHYDLIIAYANNKQIQLYENGKWLDVSFPSFVDCLQYRIKPEPVRDVLRDALIINSLSAGPLLYSAAPSEANLELVFDGATGKLKAVSFKQPQKPF